MRKIKDILPKPSDAIQAMIDGLEEQSKRPDFEVNMSFFGLHDKEMCFGCAATCAAQKAFGRNLSFENIEGTDSRAAFFETDIEEYDAFESAIDDFRSGKAFPLFKFYGIDPPNSLLSPPFYLGSATWRREIVSVESYLEKVKALGL